MKKKIESYQGAAGGWGAVKSVANAVRKQMDIRQDVIAMFDMNKPEGFRLTVRDVHGQILEAQCVIRHL